MKEYDIFVPLYFNDGSRVEAEKFQELQFEQEEILIIERDVEML